MNRFTVRYLIGLTFAMTVSQIVVFVLLFVFEEAKRKAFLRSSFRVLYGTVLYCCFLRCSVVLLHSTLSRSEVVVRLRSVCHFSSLNTYVALACCWTDFSECVRASAPFLHWPTLSSPVQYCVVQRVLRNSSTGGVHGKTYIKSWKF